MKLLLPDVAALKVAGQVFNGNKSHMDHFSAIHLEKNYMLVGAR